MDFPEGTGPTARAPCIGERPCICCSLCCRWTLKSLPGTWQPQLLLPTFARWGQQVADGFPQAPAVTRTYLLLVRWQACHLPPCRSDCSASPPSASRALPRESPITFSKHAPALACNGTQSRACDCLQAVKHSSLIYQGHRPLQNSISPWKMSLWGLAQVFS